MKKILISLLAMTASASTLMADVPYVASPETVKSQREFAADRFGIFIHWGIYSMFGQGEWYLDRDEVKAEEYCHAADGFYPSKFDAEEWARIIKDSGAKYLTFTSRHHDGFSMWHTEQSPYNIVDATPFKRDVLREIADACAKNDIKLHLYYSHIDWGRPDYPKGRSGRNSLNDSTSENWAQYRAFMDRQLKELLTQYGPIRAIWFDGLWDHDQDTIVPFDWQLRSQYDMIHSLQPGCMVANNHHLTPFEGEDIQIFERDLPGQNTEGLSGQDISRLPLETCNTVARGWGYKVNDINYYKSSTDLIRYLVKTAGMGANLLLNVGPRPDGCIPERSAQRLADIGSWLKTNGETIYSTSAGDFPAQEWGTSTRLGDRLFIHILKPGSTTVELPLACKVKSAKAFADGKPVEFQRTDNGYKLTLDPTPDVADYIVELKTSEK